MRFVVLNFLCSNSFVTCKMADASPESGAIYHEITPNLVRSYPLSFSLHRELSTHKKWKNSQTHSPAVWPMFSAICLLFLVGYFQTILTIAPVFGLQAGFPISFFFFVFLFFVFFVLVACPVSPREVVWTPDFRLVWTLGLVDGMDRDWCCCPERCLLISDSVHASHRDPHYRDGFGESRAFCVSQHSWD